jgi:hypothetical protein
VPERKTQVLQGAANSPELNRVFCEKTLEKAGVPAKSVPKN